MTDEENTMSYRLQARSQGGGGGVIRLPPPLQAEDPHFGHPLVQTFHQLQAYELTFYIAIVSCFAV